MIANHGNANMVIYIVQLGYICDLFIYNHV